MHSQDRRITAIVIGDKSHIHCTVPTKAEQTSQMAPNKSPFFCCLSRQNTPFLSGLVNRGFIVQCLSFPDQTEQVNSPQGRCNVHPETELLPDYGGSNIIQGQ